MSIPEWLTQDYIEKVLKVYHKDLTLKIEKFNIKPALEKGENYGSFLSKAHVLYTLKNGQEKKENYFICKTSFEDDEFAKAKMAPYDIFNCEMSLYEKVLPKLNELLREINDSDNFFPTAIHVDYERQALIFEDLTFKGFVMADRIEGLDMDHINLVLKKLAKLHATSAVFNELNNACLEKYDKGYFNKYTDSYKTFFVNSFLSCAHYLQEQNDEESHKYAEKIFAMKDHYMDIGKRCFKPTKGHVNVLNHGDIWTNNMMFKYCTESGKPIDVLLIDFQNSFWGSPSLDLHYLFNTSIKEPLRRYQQDKLFHIYYKIFSNTLSKLNYVTNPIPSLKQFRIQAEEKRYFAVHCSIVLQPVLLNQDPTDADYNSLMGEDDRAMRFKRRVFNNAIIQDNLKHVLPVLYHRGFLDINQ